MNDKIVRPEGPIKKNELQLVSSFTCPVYLVEKPEFLEDVNSVSEEYLHRQYSKQKLDEIYPVMMTENYADDFRLKKFVEYIGYTSWNILNDQGYDLSNFSLFFESIWTQEHHKQSSMEQHVHAQGVQIVGFYFLEVPENSSRLLFHDPRIGKNFCDLPQKNPNDVTISSQMINFTPKPGLLVFSNAWLPHSFTRNASDKPIKFVHFNIGATVAHQIGCQASAVEVI